MPHWAAAVQTELQILLPDSAGLISVESCQSSRDAMDLLKLRNSVGLILVPAGIEKECCHLLSKTAMLSRERPALIVAEDQHRGVLPVLLESGPCSVLMNVTNDRPIALWCEQVWQSEFHEF